MTGASVNDMADALIEFAAPLRAAVRERMDDRDQLDSRERRRAANPEIAGNTAA